MARYFVVFLFLLLSSCTGSGSSDRDLEGGTEISLGSGTVLANRFTTATASLYLNTLGPAAAEAEFLFPSMVSGNTRINLISVSPTILDLRMRCFGPARLFPDGRRGVHMRAGHWVRFSTMPREQRNAHILVGSGVNSCEISWGSGKILRLTREESIPSQGAVIDPDTPVCARPNTGSLDALQTVFFAESALSQTCAFAINSSPVMLSDPIDALNARIEALTGNPVARARLLQGNPDMVLDFSQAPELEMIYVSYLMMRADYTGHLMRRMLEWHAARGANIRIILTNHLMLAHDCALFENLAAAYPNVQLQLYQWSKPGDFSPSNALDAAQRAHHIKVFATLARDDQHSRLIVGGRNLWDGFFFEHPLDLSAWPELRSYREDGLLGVLYHSSYVDFEVELRGRALVAEVLGQISAYWHRDMHAQRLGPMPLTGGASFVAKNGVARHFLSVPWADDDAQLAYFSALLDAAQDEILITSPFFYPPPKILNALLRARARGVRVQMVVQVKSTDPAAIFTNALNAGFLRRFGADFEIHAFNTDDKMLHSKMLLIDGRLAVVTSTNWNRRSFLHDTENGLVFLDREITADLRQVFESYMARSTRVRATDTAPWFEQVVLELTDIWQYF